MTNTVEIPSKKKNLPPGLQGRHVVAYCRVSTDQEEQDSSIALQEMYYQRLIEGNPNWTSAIFFERASGLNLKERPAFKRMMEICRKK